MYSNNNSGNPYHQLPPSFYQYSSSSAPPPFISHESDSNNNNILFHYYHHHHPLSAAQLLPQTFLSPETSAVATLAALNNNNPSGSSVPPALNPVLPEKVVKKDRHSKIFTAQGLRDRRVRLSTEIARQFFDLQDLLGYDKASETIAWLLMKCRKDIKKLVETKGNSSSRGAAGMSLSPISESETVPSNFELVEDGDDLEGLVSQDDESLMADSSKEKRKKTFRGPFQLLGKEARAKAKANALERTREKMCNTGGGIKKSCPESSHHIFEVGEKSCTLKGIAEIGGTDSIANNQIPREEIMEESIVIRRKMKQTSAGLGYLNWDINGPNNTASSCYPTPTMNLSTGIYLHIF